MNTDTTHTVDNDVWQWIKPYLIGLCAAYILGTLGFHFSWFLVLFYVVWYGLERTKHLVRRELQKEVKKEGFREKLKAGRETAYWFNLYLGKMWPYMNRFFSVNLKEYLATSLAKSSVDKPMVVESISIQNVDFGDTPVRIANVKVHDTVQKFSFECDVEYDGEAKLEYELAVRLVNFKVPLLVQNIFIRGRMTFEITFTSRFPFMYCIDMAFIQKPEVDFSIKSSGIDVMGIPGLKEFFEGVKNSPDTWIVGNNKFRYYLPLWPKKGKQNPYSKPGLFDPYELLQNTASGVNTTSVGSGGGSFGNNSTVSGGSINNSNTSSSSAASKISMDTDITLTVLLTRHMTALNSLDSLLSKQTQESKTNTVTTTTSNDNQPTTGSVDQLKRTQAECMATLEELRAAITKITPQAQSQAQSQATKNTRQISPSKQTKKFQTLPANSNSNNLKSRMIRDDSHISPRTFAGSNQRQFVGLARDTKPTFDSLFSGPKKKKEAADAPVNRNFETNSYNNAPRSRSSLGASDDSSILKTGTPIFGGKNTDDNNNTSKNSDNDALHEDSFHILDQISEIFQKPLIVDNQPQQQEQQRGHQRQKSASDVPSLDFKTDDKNRHSLPVSYTTHLDNTSSNTSTNINMTNTNTSNMDSIDEPAFEKARTDTPDSYLISNTSSGTSNPTKPTNSSLTTSINNNSGQRRTTEANTVEEDNTSSPLASPRSAFSSTENNTSRPVSASTGSSTITRSVSTRSTSSSSSSTALFSPNPSANNLKKTLTTALGIKPKKRAVRPGKLHIDVLEGKDLVSEEGSSELDPYCLIQFGEAKFATGVCTNTCTPRWDTHMEINITSPKDPAQQHIVVEVWNKSLSQSNVHILGRVVVPFSDLLVPVDGGKARSRDEWAPLRDCVKGMVRLKLTYVED